MTFTLHRTIRDRISPEDLRAATTQAEALVSTGVHPSQIVLLHDRLHGKFCAVPKWAVGIAGVEVAGWGKADQEPES